MTKWLSLILAIIVAATISSLSVRKVFDIHKADQTTHFSRVFFLPHEFAQILSMRFNGVVSDYLMLNLMVIHGEKLIAEVPLTADEWQKTYKGLQQITSLDPAFLDPYIFAQMSLPWDAGMVDETNKLLLKAAKQRPDDYRPYFFLWFNYDYFLKDPKTAGMYLQKASLKPGAPRWYASLAARMNVYGGDLLNGITFLREMIAQSNNAGAIYHWKIRLECLEKIAFLESKLLKYKEQYGQGPKDIKDLVTSGLIQKIPTDPYGGDFYINEHGRVYTTSKMAYAPAKKK